MQTASVIFGDSSDREDPYVDMSAPELAASGNRIVQLAPGISAVLPAVYVVPDHEGYTVRMTLDLMDAGIRPTAVSVVSRASGEPITGQAMRAVRVAEIFSIAVANVIQVDASDGTTLLDPVANPGVAFDDPASEVEQQLAQTAARYAAFLERISATYRAAAVSGIPPQRFVMDVFNAPRSTAGYWISQARKKGLLAPPEKRGSQE